MSMSKWLVRISKKTVLDIGPYLPRDEQGILINPSKNTEKVIENHFPDHIEQYRLVNEQREKTLNDIHEKIKR